ncbi:unnamed protein product, partial [Mesorhabditis spiculigera]
MRQTAGSSFFWYLVASFLMLASVASAFYVPYGEDYYFAPAAEKRSVAFAPRHEKREFSADDLSLRFGKRSGSSSLHFNPEDIHLRFGRK